MVIGNNKVSKRISPLNVGKWMLFIPVNNIDDIWKTIKRETEIGNLGISAKVSTMLENPNALNNNIKLICVYTNDYENKKMFKKLETN